MSQLITNVIGGLYNPYDFESITVSSTAIGLTSSLYNPSTVGTRPLDQAQYVIITSETNDIRYRIDGTDPTASVGHKLVAGSSMVLAGYSAIVKFKSIATGSDATLMVTYER